MRCYLLVNAYHDASSEQVKSHFRLAFCNINFELSQLYVWQQHRQSDSLVFLRNRNDIRRHLNRYFDRLPVEIFQGSQNVR